MPAVFQCSEWLFPDGPLRSDSTEFHEIKAHCRLRWYSNFPDFAHSKHYCIMGKDREGKFHPGKGKPSASKKIEGTTGLKDINTSTIKEYLDIADKYTVGEEEPAANVKVRHPNRNADKHEERQSQKRDNNNEPNESYKSKTETFTIAQADTSIEELPSIFTKDHLVELANKKADHCISIYLPTQQAGAEKNEQKDTIVFKNILQQITYQLRQQDIDQGKIESLLKPGYDLLRDEQFWLTLNKGLAVFLSENELKYLRLPYNVKEDFLVNTSFLLAPLVPLIAQRDYFYLLVLSKKQAKLYRADNFGIVHIPVPEMPNGIVDVVHLEEKDDEKLFRTESAGGGQGANYHGQGAGKPDEKKNIALYFDEVDETLKKSVLQNENAPLLLAGVEYMIPIYKSVAKYKPIWNEPITGSHEHEDMQSLYRQAMTVMEPFFKQRTEKALEMYGNQSATALTSSIAEDVIPAAHYKKVWHLFIQRDAHIWGAFDEMKNELILHESQQPGDEDLIDKAMLKTILSAGEVHFLDKEKMPAETKIAALMRY
jgi:hypothetical protein